MLQPRDHGLLIKSKTDRRLNRLNNRWKGWEEVRSVGKLRAHSTTIIKRLSVLPSPPLFVGGALGVFVPPCPLFLSLSLCLVRIRVPALFSPRYGPRSQWSSPWVFSKRLSSVVSERTDVCSVCANQFSWVAGPESSPYFLRQVDLHDGH